MSTAESGAYLRYLRDQNNLSRDDVAEAVGVKRGTIERLEKGDPTIAIGTVTQVLAVVGASPGHYYMLSTYPQLSLEQVIRHESITAGILTYIRAIAEHRQLSLDTVADMIGIPGNTFRGDGHKKLNLQDLALVLGLISINAPLADLESIVHASHNHHEVAHQLANDRMALMAQNPLDQAGAFGKSQSIPLIEAIHKHLIVIQRNGENLPAALRLDLSRAIADVNKLRTVLMLLLQVGPDL